MSWNSWIKFNWMCMGMMGIPLDRIGNYASPVLDFPCDFCGCFGVALLSKRTILGDDRTWMDVHRCASSDGVWESPSGWMIDCKRCIWMVSHPCALVYGEWECCCSGTTSDNMGILDLWILHCGRVHGWLVYHAARMSSGILSMRKSSGRPLHRARCQYLTVPPFQFQRLVRQKQCIVLWCRSRCFEWFCTVFDRLISCHLWQRMIAWFLVILTAILMRHSFLRNILEVGKNKLG